jgi:hypothetical protein
MGMTAGTMAMGILTEMLSELAALTKGGARRGVTGPTMNATATTIGASKLEDISLPRHPVR